MDGGNPFGQWYREVPPITKIYSTLCVLTALLCHLGYITLFQLYYHPSLVFFKYQFWRIFTTFLYFGDFSLEFLFHMFFMTRYCRSLEEDCFRNRRADFAYMLVFGALFFLCFGPVFGMFFLGSPFVFMMVYVWSRRNPYVLISFLGLFVFTAPWLPWVLFGLSVLMTNSTPIGDLLGIVAGHTYYFLKYVYPVTSGYRILETPQFLERLLDGRENIVPPPPSPIPEDAAAAAVGEGDDHHEGADEPLLFHGDHHHHRPSPPTESSTQISPIIEGENQREDE